MTQSTPTGPRPQLIDPSLLIGRNLIDGGWKESESGKRFDVFGLYSSPCIYTYLLTIPDPSTGSFIGSCPESTIEDTQQAIAAAAKAFPAWRSRTGRDRSRILRRWYELVMKNSDDLATLIGWENGKAKPDAMGEVISAAGFLEWFSEESARVYGDVIPHRAASLRVSVLKEPVGVCGLITPHVASSTLLFRRSSADVEQLELSCWHGYEEAGPGIGCWLHRCAQACCRDSLYCQCIGSFG